MNNQQSKQNTIIKEGDFMPTLTCVSFSENDTIIKENKKIIEFAQKYSLSCECRPGDSCRPD